LPQAVQESQRSQIRRYPRTAAVGDESWKLTTLKHKAHSPICDPEKRPQILSTAALQAGLFAGGGLGAPGGGMDFNGMNLGGLSNIGEEGMK
jgi:hypothetical protein